MVNFMRTQSNYYVIQYTIRLVYHYKSLQIVVSHRTNAGI